MTNPTLDAVQYLLMAKMASQMYYLTHCIFWQTLPDSVPDLTAHLPALTAVVRNETDLNVLKVLSSHPLPTIFSPETVHWRPLLIAAWTEQLKAGRNDSDRNDSDRNDSDSKEPIFLSNKYISALRGLARADGCGMPPGMTPPSVLPTLLGEARDLLEQFRQKTAKITCASALRQLHERQLEGLAILAGWHPTPNVRTDPAVLNEWEGFWFELYQNGYMDIRPGETNTPIIVKGIAAKALLHLLESREKEKTGGRADIKPLLLKSLTMAAKAAETTEETHNCLGMLNWQPQNVNRFPAGKSGVFARNLLKKFEMSCRKGNSWFEINLRQTVLEELLRLDQAGLNLSQPIVTIVNYYLDNRVTRNEPTGDLLNHQLCRWLARSEIVNVKGGRELLQKLENHWRAECHAGYSGSHSRNIAWYGRIQLQRAGLATETPSTFQEDLLEAIKNEKSEQVRLVLSLWRPGENTPDRVRRQWRCLWAEGLKSDSEAISRTSAVALLRPDPHEDTVDPIARYQKLRATLWEMPKQLRPELSMTELMHLTGRPALENLNVTPHAEANQRWQFRPEETRFRVPTEPAAPASLPATVQTVRPDRTIQRTAGSEPQPGR